MKSEGLANYASVLQSTLGTVRKIQDDLANREKAVRLERAIGLALSDARCVQAWKTTPS
jgi:hypothetical protein